MKYLKTLGLAVIAATALMAMFGVGSAAALQNITLCKVAENPCKAENHYPTGTVIEAKNVGNTTLVGSLGTVTCTSSSVKGETTSTGGAAVSTITGKITSLSFSGCSLTTPFGGSTHSCSVTPVSGSLPYEVHLERIAATTGSFIITNPNVNITCSAAFINCNVTKPTVTLKAESTNHPSPGPARLTAEGAELSSTAGACNNSKWTATYEITKPSPLYIETS